ncbi:MAG TPA: hypothetical protein VK277_06660 [Acidimicrobiales bacterium]|nr:hypothetical protein [Acidimicrobiales bacterium]
MNLKRALLASGLAMVFVLTTGVGVASAKNPKATGTVFCGGVNGTGTLNPGLSAVGSPGGMKITFHGTFAGNCDSAVATPPGVVVTGGTIKGSGFYNAPPGSPNASACANFLGGDTVGTITETIKWTTTGGAIAPTKIVYMNQTGTVTAPPAVITLMAPPGTATKTGSFAVPLLPNLTKLPTNLPLPACPGTTTHFNIIGGSINV